jgi:alcohol dehydrogenase (cytochrome c)
MVWYYQFSPGDPYDYDGTNELVLGELALAGKPTKVLMQANRNGFFYVLDRTTGKFISGTQFAKKVNWASGIDAAGKPIDTPMTTEVRKTEQQTDFIEVWPSAFGGKNWMPMSFDPVRKVAYFNTINLGMKIKYVKQEKPDGPNWWLGLELGGFISPEDGNRGALVAWDPVAKKKLWETPSKAPNWSGVLSTAGSLVFVGTQTGQFKAFDAKSGKELWRFQTGSGITGLPIAWESKGRQYITITSGSATVYGALAGDPELANIPAGGSVWTFALPQ